eukprot:TRINITY_DN53288_c0_g1_i1.p1 TRINITY_DN53288_c0_g1~~TRINITY_DN53288_c0_g1_i1.p1  ORF type:complete len:149 (-),score=34.68 TRINITY_DN53288_c0_g1_i1:51-497(-)
MKKDQCYFGGSPIHPGRGIRYVPALVVSTRAVLAFQCNKTFRLFLRKKNPRKIDWTVMYRKINKKNVTEEVIRKRARKVKKVQRAYTGADLETIRHKKAQRNTIRIAARDAAVKEIKERKEKKKVNKNQGGGKQQKMPVQKQHGKKGR